MHFLIRATVLLAAGAAGWALAKRNSSQIQQENDPHVVYLKDEDAVIDAQEEPVEPQPMPAQVKSCYRRMDPLSLNAANEAVFLLEDGTEVKLNFTGEGGLYLKEGDRGMLTWQGMRLIRFEKDNGDVIGGMFYAPAGEDETNE
jgi:hypothetical protein